MIRTALLAGLASAAVLVPVLASAADEPKALVTAFYTEPSLFMADGKASTYFASDLSSALRARARTLAFDYRYGVRDPNISGLEILQEVDNDAARVVAVFKNSGRAYSVEWSMCRRADGEWRIADASSNTGEEEWSLRRMLNLPDKIRC